MLDISTVSWNSVGAQNGRRWKHLAESFPNTCRSVLTPSWLSSDRAWKAALEECDTHRRRIQYLTRAFVQYQ